MARGISEADVFEAADLLLARGERPTIERVRQTIGSGSPNTVNRHLDAWWTSLANRIQGKSGSTLPASLIELCQRLYDGVRSEAEAQARSLAAEIEARQSEDRANVESMLSSVKAEKAGIAETVQRLREDLQVVSVRNEMLVADRARLGSELEVADKARKALTAELADVTARVESMKRSQQNELARVREQSQSNEARWLREIDTLRDDVKRQRIESANAAKASTKQLGDLQSQLIAAARRETALQASLQKSESTLREERKSHIKALTALSSAKALVTELRRNNQGRKPSSKHNK